MVTSEDTARFAAWLLDRVIADARGDRLTQANNAPRGRFWLGRLAPEVVVRNSRFGERGERLDPCEIGIRVRPTALDGRELRCSVHAVAWVEDAREGGERIWRKVGPIGVEVAVPSPIVAGEIASRGADELAAAFVAVGAPGLSAEVHAEIEEGRDGPELLVTLVNTSPGKVPSIDPAILYETRLQVDAGETYPFVLDDLPDSFRYDRTVDAYGINCGVDRISQTNFATNDTVRQDRQRIQYWDSETAGTLPDLTFRRLATDPVPSVSALVRCLRTWGDQFWTGAELQRRSLHEQWSPGMLERAGRDAEAFWNEVDRIEDGVRVLAANAIVRRAFSLMNRAFERTVGIGHENWRPFQLGFLLANIPAIVRGPANPDRAPVDTLWFATGGGKTETYLGLAVAAAFADRIRGKHYGITAWARFPLRMLSLQQTQRFANILAAAELIRREEGIAGDVFSLGFLVGEPGTPNRIRSGADRRPGEPDPNDPGMPRQYQILLRCPFCGSEDIAMRFDRRRWTLDHCCANRTCPWRGALPFHIVDDEIFRFLPTVVVGTLDKAASISLQASMRGFYAAPFGFCPEPGHGFTYARRAARPQGCLVPDCGAVSAPLPQDGSLFPPSIHIQDELHLLRDSLGAVDAHYESLLDHLQIQSPGGENPKVVASSATIAGYSEQVGILYRRPGRLFPLPGPRFGKSFWALDSDQLARIFVGLAPRGVTIDYAADRTNEACQRAVRDALEHPALVAAEAAVAEPAIPELVALYGVDVVYGCTLRDVEAAARSFETQIPLEPINAVTLTGRTPLDEVRDALRRLVNPEDDFGQRIHLVAASSMLSHGVDLDRLNVMVMLGIPLSTAEFIQATSRVGRRHPALVIVLHKIGRERDAKVFRTFRKFVEHADRLIDPVPITRRSRRVLELTFPGLFMGRLYGVHEPAALGRRLDPLTMVRTLRRAVQTLPIVEDDECRAIVELLGITGPLDEGMRNDVRGYLREVFRAINDPATSARFVPELLPAPLMRSLRDVEDEVPVYSSGGTP